VNPTRAPHSGPVRTCTGCRERDSQANLLRIARVAERVIADPRRRAPGRGAYVHFQTACAHAATRKGGLARALRMRIGADDGEALRTVVAELSASRKQTGQTGSEPLIKPCETVVKGH
jgi:uncharacterized protein